MAGYEFSTITDAQAAGFGEDDYLFIGGGATANQVQVSRVDNGVSNGVTLSYGGRTVTFNSDISDASFANHIQFTDGTHLQIGTNGVDGDFGPAGDGNATTAYGLDGVDDLDFSMTGMHLSNYLNGGFGADTIEGGAGNNHIYGNSQYAQQGSTDAGGNVDGGDTITATTGSNYINGNGGADMITVGVDAANGVTASVGTNRVFGGSGNDIITLQGHGSTTANGNVGSDMINGSTTTGTNTLRGGQDSDMIYAGHGNNTILGDAGDDHLYAGAGTTTTTADGSVEKLTIMTGGSGNDTFDFAGAAHTGQAAYTDAGYAGETNDDGIHSGITIGDSTYYQTITDFTQGQDQIHLAFTVDSDDLITGGGATFQSVAQAEVYAQGLLTNNDNPGTGAGEIAAIDVNGSTYLFYNHAGTGTIDSIVELQGVSSSTLSQSGSGTHTFG